MVRGCTDAEATSLWLELLLEASECFNKVAISVNDEWLSSHEMFLREPPALATKSLPPADLSPCTTTAGDGSPGRMCYFFNIGYNHERECYRLLDVDTGRVAYSHDAT